MGDITLDSFRKIANVDVRTKDQIVDLRRGRGGDTLIARDIKDAKKAVAGESYVRNTFYNAIVKSLQKTGKELDEGLLDWVRGKLGIVQSRRPLPPKPLTMRVIKECLERVDSQSTQNIYHDGYTDDFVMVAHGDDSFFDNHLQKEFAAIREKFNAGEDIRTTRNRMFVALRAQYPTLDPKSYEKLDVKGLAKLCGAIVERPEIKAADLVGFIQGLERDSQSVNTNELLDAIDRVKTDRAFAAKVTFRKPTPAETGVKALLADLAFDQDAALADNSASPERRLLKTLQKHADTLALLCANPKSTLLASTVPVAALPLLGKVVDLAKDVFGLRLEERPKAEGGFFASLFSGLGRLVSGKTDTQQYKEQLTRKLADAADLLKRGDRSEALERFNAGVDAIVDSQCEKFQAVMTKAFDSMLDKRALAPADFIYDFGGEEIARATEEIFGQGMELPDRPAGQGNAVRPEALKPLATPEQVRRYGDHMHKQDLVAEMNDGFAGLDTDGKLKRFGVLFEGFIVSASSGRQARKELRESFFKWTDLIRAGRVPMPEAIRDDMQMTFFEEIPRHVDPQFDEKLMRADPANDGAFHELPAEDVEAMDEEEREDYELRRIRSQSLDTLAGSGALDPSSGYGKYVRELMTRYFREADPMDRRAMFASMIRNAPSATDLFPKTGGEGAAPKAEDLASKTLGAFLKGAGPVMQKTLQQLSSLDVPKVFKDALADMRSNLQPLPDQVVHAMLAKLVEDSNGEITRLEVVDSLGAASVAQSIHCKLTDAKGEKRDVVVKLIRPEAENRAKREARLCLEVAGRIEGMAVPIKGRIDRIMEEFDLRIEQRNAEAGVVYDAAGEMHDRADGHIFRTDSTETFGDVHAVKVDRLSPGTRSAMIMALAPGMTIDRIIARAEKEMKALDAAYLKNGRIRGETADERRKNYREYEGKLAELHDLVRGVQQKTVHFAHSWVGTGVYGNGFFHGDAHGGNFTVDTNPDARLNKGLTVLDFGNATQLTKQQQDAVLQVIASCMLRNTQSYMSAFRSLLSDGGKADFDRLRTKVRNRIALILAKGSMAATGKVISATLTELQKLGIEIPPPVFNFSQCQLLIQGTVEQLNSTLGAIRAKMRGMTSSMADDLRNLTVEEIRRRAAAYSLDDDNMLDDSVREFLQDGNPAPETFARFEASVGEAAKYDDRLRAAYEELVNSEAYALRKTRLADERLVATYERMDDYVESHREQIARDPNYLRDRLEMLRRQAANWEGYGFLRGTVENYHKEIELIEMLQRRETDGARLEAEYRAAEDRLAEDLDLDALNAAKAVFRGKLEATRREFYRNLEGILDRQVAKTAPGQAERDFLSVMVNALFDNKLKTAWSLGPGKSLRMLWAMLTA